MGLLAKVLSGIWRSRYTADSSTPSEETLLSEFHALERQRAYIHTQQDALEFLQSDVLPLLEDVCRGGHTALAEMLEIWVYHRLIKIFERAKHYDVCFSLIDHPLRALGHQMASAGDRTSQSPIAIDWRPNRWVFLVHNLEAEMAHIKLLTDLIRSYLCVYPQRAADIRIAGLAGSAVAPCIRALRDEFEISLTVFPAQAGLYSALQELARQVNERGDERCIVVSVPHGLSFLTGLLHPERLAWLSMKFEISAFAGLVHRFSFTSGRRASKKICQTRWLSAPPLFALEPVVSDTPSLPHLERITKYQQVFFTVNREEKIRNLEYLKAVSGILQTLPTACFVWTGREALPEITSWFHEHGVEDRCFFVGWIDPDALLSRGHIFLDTPELSGSIAAKSMACGIPVMSFQGAHSWVNFFQPALDEELPSVDDAHPLAPVRRLIEHGLHLECKTLVEYVAQAMTLAHDHDLRQLYAEGMRAFAQYYFMRHHSHACMHFENFAITLADHPDDGAYMATGQFETTGRSENLAT